MRTISPCGSRSCSDARRDARSRAPREFIDGIVRCEMFLSDLGTLAQHATKLQHARNWD